MLARISSSLTAAGPTCLISMRAILPAASWPRHNGSAAMNSQISHRRNADFIMARSVGHVVVAYFCCAFEARIGPQKRQVYITGRAVALLRNQQIHGHCFFLRTGGCAVLVVTTGLV